MKSRIVRYSFGALAALVIVVAPSAAYAQPFMSFSFYTDVAIGDDGQTYFTVIDGSDNSSTYCSHHDYHTSMHVTGPSGYYNQQVSGLSSYMNVPFAVGNYSIGSDSTYYCDCIQSTTSAGGGYSQQTTGNFEANYYADGDYLGLWVYKRCDPGFCATMHLVPNGNWSAYKRLTIFYSAEGGIRKCFTFNNTQISSCSGLP